MASSPALQIERDDKFQRRDWVFQRAMWALGALVLFASLLGVFGAGGPLVTGTAEGGSFSLEYERLSRRDKAAELLLEVEDPASEVVVEIGNAFLKDVDIRQIVPEPESSSLTEGGIVLTFASQGEGLGGITIEYEPDNAGLLAIDVTLDGQAARGTSFVYP